MPAKVKGGTRYRGALADIAKKLSKKNTVRVGFLEKAKYPNGTPVAMVAAIQNFGAPRAKIPPRPFFSNMVKEKKKDWPKAVAENLRETNYDTGQTLERMGMVIAAQLQQSIIDTLDPPLSPVTVMLRGMRANDAALVVTKKTVGIAAQRVADGKTNYGASTKPLVDTGFLLRSVGYEVNKK